MRTIWPEWTRAWESSLRFSLVLSAFWPLLTRSNLPPGHHENNLIWVDSSLWSPLVLLLATAHTAQSPCLTISKTIWYEWTQSKKSPFAYLQIPPWVPSEIYWQDGLRTCIYIYILYTVHFPFASWLNVLFNLLCRFCILIMEMYSKYFTPITGKPVDTRHLWVNKHHPLQDKAHLLPY